MLLAVQFVAAQKTLYVLSKEGKLSAYSASKVTFDNAPFTFTYGEVTEITKESFSASFSVAFNSTDYKSFNQTPEVGICFSDVNETPTIADGKIEKGSSLTNYSFSINGLDAGTTYYYRAYVKVNDAVYYGDVKSETTFGNKPTYKIINGHKFVDLGLPSGLLWATCNVGAAIAADDGCFFAWGETEATKSSYERATYKYGTSEGDPTKYNSTDGKTTLDNEDDAAYVNWGSSCRMPTNDEFSELLNSDNCIWNWVSMTTSSGSSIRGYYVTSVKNGNSIFFPASGFLHYEKHSSHGQVGYYWSRTLSSSVSYHAYCLTLTNTMHNSDRYYYSYDGQSVRPVAESSATQDEQTVVQKSASQQEPRQNMLIVGSNGSVNAVSVSSVDYATFNADNKWFCITNDGIEAATTASFSASCTVGLAGGSNIKELGITPQVGVCYSKINAIPTIDDNCESLGSELTNYTFTLSSLFSGTTYYYRVYVKLADGVFYGDVAEAKTLGTAPADYSKTINGHKFIDLGLPSGLLWAETNVGAETAADDGNYYAWGETEPQSSNSYSSSSYKYSTSSGDYTKYNSTDGKDVLDKEDDAAYVNWGSFCHMPTKADFDELMNTDYCSWERTSMTTSAGSSIMGYKVTSTKNGNSIFFPASGVCGSGNVGFYGTGGQYWSSTLFSDYSDAAYLFMFTSSSKPQYTYGYRSDGRTVRPVAQP